MGLNLQLVQRRPNCEDRRAAIPARRTDGNPQFQARTRSRSRENKTLREVEGNARQRKVSSHQRTNRGGDELPQRAERPRNPRIGAS